AQGQQPISYQWRRNGSLIAGATSSVFTLNNVQFADHGDYTVVLTNFYGSRNSTPASVSLTVSPDEFNAALDTTNLVWITGGDAPWFAETDASYDGLAAADSGAITNGQQSYLQTSVTGPCTVRFWWAIVHEGGFFHFAVGDG